MAVLAAAIFLPIGSAATGEDRVLLVLATDGPTPYSTEQVERVVRDTETFLRASSFGRLSVRFEVTPWLSAFAGPPGCGGSTNRSLDGLLIAPARAAAARAGYDLSSYDQLVYAFPQKCGFYGITMGHQVILTRMPSVELLAHELGHTFGLGHAQGSSCALGCVITDPGDPYTVMGTGQRMLDFSAYEKSLLGWIGPQPHASTSGNYRIVPPTRQTSRAQALVVQTASGQWWIEYRANPFRGLLVRFVDAVTPPPFAAPGLLMRRPVKTTRDWVAVRETYRVPRLFSVRLAAVQSGVATVRFGWTTPSRGSAG